MKVELDIDNEEQPKLCFNITEDGEKKGEIEDHDYVLHRLMLQAQADAAKDGHKEPGEYIPYYAKLLHETYGVKVNERSAYKIADYACNSLHMLKKNIDG